jgi:hypothetical protein
MYILLSTIDNKPEVLYYSENLEFLKDAMEDEAISYVTDNVGKNNWINTLEENVVEFKTYPNYLLKRKSDKDISIYHVTKEHIVKNGWIYNETLSIKKETYIGNIQILSVKNNINSTPTEDIKTDQKQKKQIIFKKNFNKVLIDLMTNSLIKRRNSIEPALDI